MTPVPVDEFEDSVVNYLDQGNKYVAQYDPEKPKRYKFSLVKPLQKYADTCGPIQYSVVVEK